MLVAATRRSQVAFELVRELTWDDFREEEEEDGQTDEDGNAERDLLPAVTGQVAQSRNRAPSDSLWEAGGGGWSLQYEDGEEGDADAGEDEVDGVEERLAAELDVVLAAQWG